MYTKFTERTQINTSNVRKYVRIFLGVRLKIQRINYHLCLENLSKLVNERSHYWRNFSGERADISKLHAIAYANARVVIHCVAQ